MVSEKRGPKPENVALYADFLKSVMDLYLRCSKKKVWTLTGEILIKVDISLNNVDLTCDFLKF